MIYKIDIKKIIDGKIHVQGWVLPEKPESDVSFSILNSNFKPIDFKIVRLKRDDVAEVHLENYDGDKNFGFDLEFDYNEGDLSTYYLNIETEGKKCMIKPMNRRAQQS